MLYKFIFIFYVLNSVLAKDRVDVDGILKKLQAGFKVDDESAVPPIHTRVLILADIFNGYDLKHKNLTNEPYNIQSTVAEFKKRTDQLDQYKELSLLYLQREFNKSYNALKDKNAKIQNDEIKGLDIANAILPYTTKLGSYCEKLNDIYDDPKIKGLIKKYRAASYQLIGYSREHYKEMEAKIFYRLSKLADLAGYERFDRLIHSQLIPSLRNRTEGLEKANPEEVDVMREQYEFGRILHALRQLLVVIIESEAIMEGIPNPFLRETNTIGDQQSKEYFGVQEYKDETQT